MSKTYFCLKIVSLSLFCVLSIYLFVFAFDYDIQYDLMKTYIQFKDPMPAVDIWMNSPFGKLEIYLFNVTNSEEFLGGCHKKIRLEQIGPITYNVIGFNDILSRTEDSVTYRRNRYRHINFLPYGSVSPNILNQTIVQVNDKAILDRSNTLFSSISVYDFLHSNFDPFNNATKEREEVFTVNIGIKHGMENFFRIQTLNGEYSIKTYDRANSSSSCSINVEGAFDNSLFPPFITKNTSLNIFVSELCRVIPLHYQREETKQDLNGYRYVLQRPNEKECLPVENGKPLPKDMYDMSKCANNDIPTAFSAPHFYGSSYNWSENFEGLNPNAEEHEAYILLLPMMGIPINNNLRFQSNMVLPDLSYLDNKLSHLSNKIMPRLWYEFEMGKLPFIVHFVMYTNILQRIVMILPPLAALWSLNKIIKIRRQFNYKTINNTYNQQKANI